MQNCTVDRSGGCGSGGCSSRRSGVCSSSSGGSRGFVAVVESLSSTVSCSVVVEVVVVVLVVYVVREDLQGSTYPFFRCEFAQVASKQRKTICAGLMEAR